MGLAVGSWSCSWDFLMPNPFSQASRLDPMWLRRSRQLPWLALEPWSAVCMSLPVLNSCFFWSSLSASKILTMCLAITLWQVLHILVLFTGSKLRKSRNCWNCCPDSKRLPIYGLLWRIRGVRVQKYVRQSSSVSVVMCVQWCLMMMLKMLLLGEIMCRRWRCFSRESDILWCISC